MFSLKNLARKGLKDGMSRIPASASIRFSKCVMLIMQLKYYDTLYDMIEYSMILRTSQQCQKIEPK